MNLELHAQTPTRKPHSLSQVHKTTFNTLPASHEYGYEIPKDPEGAGAVINTWKPHVANPHSKPGPDIKAMNRLAATHGLTEAPQQRPFRSTHMVLVKEGKPVAPPLLPSDVDPQHVYGMKSSHRTMDDIRHLGPVEPKCKDVIQVSRLVAWLSCYPCMPSCMQQSNGHQPLVPASSAPDDLQRQCWLS